MELTQSQIDKNFANFNRPDREIMVILGKTCTFFVQGKSHQNLGETRRKSFSDFGEGYKWAASVTLEHQSNFHLASDYGNWPCH